MKRKPGWYEKRPQPEQPAPLHREAAINGHRAAGRGLGGDRGHRGAPGSAEARAAARISDPDDHLDRIRLAHQMDSYIAQQRGFVGDPACRYCGGTGYDPDSMGPCPDCGYRLDEDRRRLRAKQKALEMFHGINFDEDNEAYDDIVEAIIKTRPVFEEDNPTEEELDRALIEFTQLGYENWTLADDRDPWMEAVMQVERGMGEDKYQIVAWDRETGRIDARETGFSSIAEAQQRIDEETEYGFNPTTLGQQITIERGGGFKREVLHNDGEQEYVAKYPPAPPVAGFVEPQVKHIPSGMAKGIEPGPNDFRWGKDDSRECMYCGRQIAPVNHYWHQKNCMNNPINIAEKKMEERVRRGY